MIQKINYKLLIVFLLIALQSSLFAATYYVSTTGNDSNPGTKVEPWKTLSYAFPKLLAGDTLYMRGGTYPVSTTLTMGYRGRGTIDNPITISSYPGETAVIDGQYTVRGSEGNHIIYLKNKDHLILKDFTITRSPYFGIIAADADNIIISNLTITHCRASGIFLIRANNCKVVNNEVNECTEWGQDESISIAASNHVEVAYNHVHHNGNNGNMNADKDYHWNGIGIDIKNGCNYIDVHHNHVHDVESNGIYIDARGNTSNINIFNNLVYNCSVRGNGITMANEAPAEDRVEHINIYNNIVYNCMNGFNIGYGSMPPNIYHDVNVVNNVSYGNTYNGMKFTTDAGSTNILIANNILRNNKSHDAYNEYGKMNGVTMEHNNLSKINGATGINYTTNDPLFVDEENRDFHLQAASPAIGNGTANYFVPSIDHDDISRPLGTKPDLGAYIFKPIASTGENHYFIISTDKLDYTNQ